MKILTIVGARPQIIKAAALSRAIQNHYADRVQEVIVHTGQHYDDNMSQVFFDELGIPKPDYNLHVGSASHSVQTAQMMEGIEKTLLEERISAKSTTRIRMRIRPYSVRCATILMPAAAVSRR